MFSSTLRQPAGSRPAVGSSRMSTWGRMAITPAMAMPALLPAGELERRALEERLVHTGKARGLAHALIDLLRGEPGIFRAEGNVLIHRLLKELVLGILKDEADLKAHVARGGLARWMSSPSKSTVPDVGASRPLRCWMNVLLPEPVWPMMPTNCPAGMARSISSMATFSKGVPAL